jgi:uncharacterized protein YqfB (UPF0267 family)
MEFQDNLFNLIISNPTQKTQTRRSRKYCSEGDILKIWNKSKSKTSTIKIIKIYKQYKKNISNFDALCEGFNSKKEFIELIDNIYPNINQLYVHKFILV